MIAARGDLRMQNFELRIATSAAQKRLKSTLSDPSSKDLPYLSLAGLIIGLAGIGILIDSIEVRGMDLSSKPFHSIRNRKICGARGAQLLETPGCYKNSTFERAHSLVV